MTVFDGFEALLGDATEGGSMGGQFRKVLGPGIDLSTNLDTAQATLPAARALLDEAAPRLLDFGCGRAPHRKQAEALGFQWTGVDFLDSGAKQFREAPPEGVLGYNGRDLPFGAACFEAVLTWQALEHVHEPEQAAAEISRVLRPGGVLFGSVSFLEPFHGNSTFGYSPYGLKILFARHQIELTHLWPGMDGLSTGLRYLLAALKQDLPQDFWRKRPLRDALRRAMGPDVAEEEINLVLLRLASHVRFMARRI